MSDLLIGVACGGIVSFGISYWLNQLQFNDFKKLHEKQLNFKRNLHDQQLQHDRDVANLILRSLRHKEDFPHLPIPLIDRDMNLIFDLIPDEPLHFNDTDHLFSWDEIPVD